METNMNNPIFVYYVNIDGMTRQRAEETLATISETMSGPDMNFWIVPRTEGLTKIDVIWRGTEIEKSSASYHPLAEIVDAINERIDVMGGPEDFKIALRDWRINTALFGSK